METSKNQDRKKLKTLSRNHKRLETSCKYVGHKYEP